MRIVYCGSSEFGLHCLESIKESHHELVHIITQPAQKAGRGKKICVTPVSEWAQKNSIPCTEMENVNTPESLEFIENLKPDIFVVIAFGQKIGQDFIKIARHEAINVHGSLLPDYRGAAPINWAIIDGNKETGVTIITLADKMDAGDMLGKASVTIEPTDTAEIVHDKLAVVSAPLLLETLDKIENGTAVYEQQDHSKATLARKLKKSDGFIDWNQPAEKVANMIRGMWPWPGAKSDYIIGETGKRVRVTIASAKPVELFSDGKVEVGKFDDQQNIACSEGALQIEKIKPENSKLMNYNAFLNGRRSGPDDMFVNIENENQ